MLNLIRREPVKFAGFVQALIAVMLQMAADYGLSSGVAASLNATAALGIAWLTAAVVVPTVKLSDAAIEKATNMTQGDIAKVAATKAEAKAEGKP